jgi:hypothetical protein
MTIETIIDHDQPDFEPGNPGTRAAVRHAAQVAERLIHALFPMPLRTARTKFLLGVLEQAATTVRSWNHERSHADF